MLKQTPLNAAHRDMGAKMVDSGFWGLGAYSAATDAVLSSDPSATWRGPAASLEENSHAR